MLKCVNTFYAFVKMIVLFFSLLCNMVDYIDWYLNIETALHFWDKSYLVGVYYLLKYIFIYCYLEFANICSGFLWLSSYKNLMLTFFSSTALYASHKFLYAAFLFLFSSKYFKIDLETFFLTHALFRSDLFHCQIFGDLQIPFCYQCLI